MQKNSFLTILLYVLMVFLCVGLAVILYLNLQANEELNTKQTQEIYAALLTPTPMPTAVPTPEPEERNTEDIVFAFGGEMVGQMGLTKDAEVVEESADSEDSEEENGSEQVSYDYSAELSGLTEVLAQPDFVSCTLGSVLLESEEYESYVMNPSFASALGNAGFDLVNTATNRILYRGLEGVQSTVLALQEAGVTNLGTAATQESYDENHGVYTKVFNGVTVAFLSYTCETGDVSAADTPYAVNILTSDYMSGAQTIDYDRVESDLQYAKDCGADLIVCYVYWWSEDSYYIDVRDNQRELATYLCENGVDIVAGSGTKVPQPIELMKFQDEDGTVRNCAVIYSSGNLLNCFDDNYTNLSGLVSVNLKRDVDTNEIWISNVSYKPLFMLDTSDYSDIEEDSAEFKYRIFDLRDAVSRYEAVNSDGEGDGETLAADCITREVYSAMLEGIDTLQQIFGAEYDEVNGGMDVLAWSETIVLR